MLAEHLADARVHLNLLFSDWSNEQPNLWCVDLVEVPLVQGTATYSVDAKTVMILDAYIRTGSGDSENDRLIMPISRDEYASYPNKDVQGYSSVFWFDRQINPTITLWEVPDATGTYLLRYYRVTQIQDANLSGGETPNIPYRWLDATVTGLSARLAAIYAPEKEDKLVLRAEKAWSKAAIQDVENTSGLYILPTVEGYYR
ncbi:hypothetical protein IC762_12320 [Bradyrhizobium genosp. L]|uniref:phage adaptor protein n=1 Tax=Bradyrhizobium genosp. L TaxID=83637 RepID=UPI0018A27799|nr:hypothetical protein [Bradyrhizobium genosp. L]QPF87030.1 hypothetical protein IC762_12320 [Bradyrhizobium genosp. L]